MAFPVAFPDQEEWARRFGPAMAVAAVSDISPDLKSSVNVISTVVESETGKKIVAAIEGAAADAAADVVRGLMAGTIELAPNLVAALGQAASAFGSMVPMFKDAWAFAESGRASWEQEQRDRLSRMTDAAVHACGNRYRVVGGTGSGAAVTPSDLFRPIWEALQGPPRIYGYEDRHELPPHPVCVASLICALCGDMSPTGWSQHMDRVYTPPKFGANAGGGTISEVLVHPHGKAGYEVWIANERRARSDNKLGVPFRQRREMASAINGILGSVRPDTLYEIEKVGDQGRSLFPVLTDLLLRTWRDGRWDRPMLDSLQRSQIGCFDVMDYSTGNKIGPVVELGKELRGMVSAWKHTLESSSIQPEKRKVLTYASLVQGIEQISYLRPVAVEGFAQREDDAASEGGTSPGVVLAVAGVAVLAAVKFAR